MELKMTEKDKKLLILLAIFLVIVGGGYFGIMPLQEKIQALTKEKEELQLRNDHFEELQRRLPMLTQQNEELREELEKEKEGFFPYMENMQIDQTLTGMLVERGLIVKDLNIVRGSGVYEFKPYSYAADFNGSDYSVSDPASKCVSVAQVSLNLSGTKDALQQLIDDLSHDSYLPGIQISTYSWGTETRTSFTGADQIKTDIWQTLSLGIQIYMYKGEE